MSDIASNLIRGALGSVLGTFLFLFIDSYWRSLALPKLQDMVYRGARVDGKWECTLPIDDKQKQIYSLDITQRADSLKGTYTLWSDINEGASTSTYIFSGYITDGFILGTSRPNDRESLYHATFCLRLVEELDSIALHGKLSAMALEDNKVMAWDVHFRRSNQKSA